MKKFSAILVVLAMVASAQAATYTWTGATSNVWSVPGNWTSTDGGVNYPTGGGDTAFFTSNASVVPGAMFSPPQINITGNLTITNPGSRLAFQNYTSITGPGALALSGKFYFGQGDPNTFAGPLTILGGKLEVSGGDGRAAITSGGLILHAGFQVEADDIIDHTAPLEMGSGGWTNWSTYNLTFGTLNVSGADADWNALRFPAGVDGDGNAYPATSLNLHFADSSAIAWTGALEIDYLASSGATPQLAVGDIYFGNNASALTADQLSKITFFEMDDSFSNTGVTYAAGLDADGKLIPVPEPMTLSLLVVGGIGALLRRRNA